ncbi:MAG: hypothetical protein AB7U73_09485 [Pirellulales bacterium]
MAQARQMHRESATVRVVVRRPDPLQKSITFDSEAGKFVVPERIQLRNSRLGFRGTVTYGHASRPATARVKLSLRDSSGALLHQAIAAPGFYNSAAWVRTSGAGGKVRSSANFKFPTEALDRLSTIEVEFREGWPWDREDEE